MKTRLFLGEGTWGGEWARNTEIGTFRDHLRDHGFTCSIIVWTTDVDGLLEVGRSPSTLGSNNTDWIAGAYAERYKLAGLPYEQRNKLTHSHGIGPTLYQATLEDTDDPIVPIRNVLAICPPPRQEFLDMARVALERGTIAALRIIYADGWDPWARLGQAFDGSWGWRRDWAALEGVRGFSQRGEKGVGHSGIFKPIEWHRFADGGDWQHLKEEREVEALGV